MEHIISVVTQYVVGSVSSWGYIGVVFLMALESAGIPLPSELIMPFSGYLVSLGKLNLFGVAFAGALGCVLGSIALYFIGYYGGRPFMEKYGKYFLIRHHDLAVSEKFFAKYGNASNFIGRLLPIVRTFISFPVGVAKMDFKRFVLSTFIGSYIWSFALAWAGLKLGQHWDDVKFYFRKFDVAVAVLVAASVAYFLYVHLKKRRTQARNRALDD